MAVTQTTLSAAIVAGDLTMTVASGTGFPTTGATALAQGYLVRIDKEYMWAIAQPVAGQITLRGRGANGTAAQAHDKLAKVIVSSAPSDFAGNAPGFDVELPPYLPIYLTLGQDKTFTTSEIAAYGNQSRTFAITKATAAAITLVAPDKSQDGLILEFTSLTDATHAITATSLLANAGASSPYTTATWANAKAGGGIKLIAENALWNVISSTNVTLS